MCPCPPHPPLPPLPPHLLCFSLICIFVSFYFIFLRPSLQDVAYIVYATRRNAESDAGRGAASTITRLGFEKSMKDARLQISRAVVARAHLFAEMCEVSPKMGRLHKHANEYAAATSAAERAFAVIFSINSRVCLGGWAIMNYLVSHRVCRSRFLLAPPCGLQNVAALRMFSQFNAMVVNNPEKAELVASEADRLDEQTQVAVQQVGSHHHISDVFTAASNAVRGFFESIPLLRAPFSSSCALTRTLLMGFRDASSVCALRSSLVIRQASLLSPWPLPQWVRCVLANPQAGHPAHAPHTL
jgi:hypothetical protein